MKQSAVVIIFLVCTSLFYGMIQKEEENRVTFLSTDSLVAEPDYTLLSEREYMTKVLEDEVGTRRYVPEEGYVPDEETAKKIAEAVWLPIYGERIQDAKPFEAYLVHDSIWVVMAGGGEGYKSTPHIEMKKSTGEILFVMYYK